MSEIGMRTADQLHFGGQPSRTNLHLAAIERAVVYTAVFLAPYATLRFSELFFTFSDFFFCLSLFLLLITGRIRSRPLEGATSIWLVAFILLFLGIMLGSLFNGSPQRGLIVMGQYLFAYMILMVILIRDDQREAYRLAGIFLVSVILIDIHGIITFYTVGYVPGEGKGIVTGGKRLATVLRNPNLAAAMNALTLPILLFFWSTGRAKSYLAMPALAIIIVTVVLTSSNSGLFSTALCLAVFIALVSTPRLLLRLALGLSIVVGGAALFGSKEMLPKTFQTRVLGALSSGDISEAGTFLSRAALMEEALHIISEEQIKIIGLGADQFRERSVQSAPVHNLYLLLWVEGGLLALIGWLLFSGVGVLLSLAILRVRGDKRALAAVITTILVFLVIALFNPHMYARYWTMPVLLCFGLGLTQLRSTAPGRG
ncbi:O-antigen ligase domain-containing protein [Sinorhizobium medicae]|uniref:O-antigen ligase family protein n=1 Tax=Sinorhizobium medicae TaxID=110321 RepID=UPI000368FACD|nr:O-antigen ligase family protein [Sinorhizobium medicae]MDX0542089.1 O-antigen ligase domain-containing protein [Sinorhizobium medicae]MQY00220.1 O-antigen ligase domain-containing protein [Sinorhizobium medicae]RVI88870.1 O-antigen ligase domain-containing protein [Sinorhizobium medicae]UFX05270.1 O-antigen ligase family protein [Sinorhizobium medicae WSM1115]